jgi:hypothetical protein
MDETVFFQCGGCSVKIETAERPQGWIAHPAAPEDPSRALCPSCAGLWERVVKNSITVAPVRPQSALQRPSSSAARQAELAALKAERDRERATPRPEDVHDIPKRVERPAAQAIPVVAPPHSPVAPTAIPILPATVKTIPIRLPQGHGPTRTIPAAPRTTILSTVPSAPTPIRTLPPAIKFSPTTVAPAPPVKTAPTVQLARPAQRVEASPIPSRAKP